MQAGKNEISINGETFAREADIPVKCSIDSIEVDLAIRIGLCAGMTPGYPPAVVIVLTACFGTITTLDG